MENQRFYDFDDSELQALKYCLECGISELNWNCRDAGQAEALLDEVYDELGERFNIRSQEEAYFDGENRDEFEH